MRTLSTLLILVILITLSPCHLVTQSPAHPVTQSATCTTRTVTATITARYNGPSWAPGYRYVITADGYTGSVSSSTRYIVGRQLRIRGCFAADGLILDIRIVR